MNGSIIIVSGVGVAAGIAVIAILNHNKAPISPALKISIVLFSIVWIILSGWTCLFEEIPKVFPINISVVHTDLFSFLIGLCLIPAQLFLTIGFYLQLTAIEKQQIFDQGTERINQEQQNYRKNNNLDNYEGQYSERDSIGINDTIAGSSSLEETDSATTTCP